MILTPTLPVQALAGDGTNSLRVVFTVNRQIALRLFVNRECGGPVNDGLPFEGTGQVTYETSQADIGAYVFNAQTRVAEIPVHDSVTAVFELYTAGVLAYRSERTYVGGGYDVYAVWFPRAQFVPYASGFWFYPLSTCVRSGDKTSMDIPMTAYCWEDILWSPERDPITFSVSQGQSLGQLQDRTGHVLGNSATLKLDDAQGLTFAAFPGVPQGGTVQIDALVGEIQRSASFNVYADNEYSLALSSYDSEVQHGQQIQLLARAVACEGTGIVPAEGTTYSFRIVQGQEYGRLFHEETDAAGDNLTGISPYNGAANIWFQAWESAPTESQTVTVEMSSEGKAPVTTSFQVTPGGLAVTALPATLKYGERSTISVRKMLPDGTTEPLGLDATVTYRIVNGNQAGTLQNRDSTERADELIFPNDTVVQFSALEESPQPDTVEVLIQVEVNEGIIIVGKVSDTIPANPGNGHLNLSQSLSPSLSNTSSSGFFFGLSGVARVKVVKGVHTILLGESKYYYVVETDGALSIKETPTPAFPDEPGIVKMASVWEPNPVTRVEGGSTSGKKLGVYWETHKPNEEGTGDLPPGMIRLVGRFWAIDSSFVVALTANSGGRVSSITIQVTKPSSLGTEARTAQNIDDHIYDLDSLMILWGGKEGIPPQLIKAMIKHETSFHPAYRYEPHKDAQWQNTRQDSLRMSNCAYWITAGGQIGQPEPPQNVANLRDGRLSIRIQYPGYVGSIWDYFDANRTLYARAYRSTFARTWRGYRDSVLIAMSQKKALTTVDTLSAFPQADGRLSQYLRGTYMGGFENRVAQTRIVASYGLLQLIYYCAISDDGYPFDQHSTPVSDRLNPPERLNRSEHFCMEFSLRHLKMKFELHERFYSEGNWTEGFERSWRIALNAYNGNRSQSGVGRCPNGSETIDYGSQVVCWSTNRFRAQ